MDKQFSWIVFSDNSQKNMIMWKKYTMWITLLCHYVVLFHLWMSIIHPLWIMFIYQFSFSCLSNIYHIFWFPSFFKYQFPKGGFQSISINLLPPLLKHKWTSFGFYFNTFTSLFLNGICIYQHANLFCLLCQCLL
jgi:hypothetical protein